MMYPPSMTISCIKGQCVVSRTESAYLAIRITTRWTGEVNHRPCHLLCAAKHHHAMPGDAKLVHIRSRAPSRHGHDAFADLVHHLGRDLVGGHL
jgi:hypothetical protein